MLLVVSLAADRGVGWFWWGYSWLSVFYTRVARAVGLLSGCFWWYLGPLIRASVGSGGVLRGCRPNNICREVLVGLSVATTVVIYGVGCLRV